MILALLGDTLRQPELVGLALLAIVPWLTRRRSAAPAIDFAPAPRLEVRANWKTRLWFVPRILATVGLLLLAVALARPSKRVELPRTTRGIDILLCVDTSSSMAAMDMSPDKSRLAVAQDAARRFIADRSADAIGLVRFARYPDLTCPTTRDHRALDQFVTRLRRVEADGPEDRTGIGNALALAAKALRSSKAKSRVVVLLTDGEENVATTATPDEIGPATAAELCRELGVRVYAIAAGIGKRDRDGNWVDLDTSQLELVAKRTNGAFFRAENETSIEQVYSRIDTLEKRALDDPEFELRDHFQPSAWLALVCFCCAQLLAAFVWRRAP